MVLINRFHFLKKIKPRKSFILVASSSKNEEGCTKNQDLSSKSEADFFKK